MKTKILFIFLFFTTTAIAQKAVEHIVTLTVTFETGKYSINKKQLKKVEEYCDKMDKIRHEIGIIGYSDSHGTAEANDTLSMRRAKALRDCIHKFLPDLKINTYIGERDSAHFKLPAAQQRSASVIIWPIYLCGTEPEALKFCHGEICVSPFGIGTAIYNPGIDIRAYYTAKQMISQDMNAIDENNAILMTSSIIDICIDIKDDSFMWRGGMANIPAKGIFDPDLRMYQKKKGDRVWQETDLKINIYKGIPNYIFQVPKEEDCYSFCVGKPANIKSGANSYKTIYISTYKPFNFEDVKVSSKNYALSYSAKLNDTLIAFTLPAKQAARPMVFEGYYTRNGNPKQLTVSLRKCSFTRDKSGNEWYHIAEESLLQKEPEKKKQGFWQWLKNLF